VRFYGRAAFDAYLSVGDARLLRIFHGKEEDVDLLLLKAESFVVFGARPVVLLLDGGRR
jgi:hypothetical protein